MLPKNLKYGTKVESAPAKSYRSNIAPQNGTGTYGLGDTIIVNVPTRANLCLVPSESYLKFNFVATNGATANNDIRWDSCGAHGIIQRIRIFHGSNLLQDIDNYGLLAKLLFDLQVSTDASYGKYNILAGTRNDLIATLPATSSTYSQSELNGVKISALQINSGDAIVKAGDTLAASTDTTAQTYCLNLISLLGSLCSQNYIPLFACTSAPIRMEIQLVDNTNKAMASLTAVSGIKITNCEYVANFIELSDQAMSVIQASLQGQPLQFVIPDYRNYQFSYSASIGTSSTTQVQMPIPSKFSSLKSLFVTLRDKGTGTDTFFPFSSVSCGIQDYYFRVGSQIMPTKAPATIPEMFSEVLKAIGSMSDLSHQPSIEKTSYSLASSSATSATGSTNSGSFYIGLDLENYANAPKDSIFAGYNSNTDDIYCVVNLKPASSLSSGVRMDSFALFDEVVVFENNTAFVRY